MRGRSSSKQGTKGGLEIDKIDKLKEEPHLSGAYIRNLVKQLTSTRTKDPNSKDHENLDGDGLCSYPNLTKNGDGISESSQQSQPPQQPPQHKKQVRRRLHTSRPYQERLLNMAEARREIVTALKFHRAAMKQAHEEQQQQQQQQRQLQETQLQPSQPSLQLPLELEGKSKSRRNSRIYASNMSNSFTNYVDNLSYSAFAYPPNNPYSWPLPPVTPPILTEDLNFALPNQTLGLNLNLQDFNNVDSNFCHSSNNSAFYCSTSSPSSSSSPPLSVAIEELPSMTTPGEGFLTVDATNAKSSILNYGDSGLHHAMDDKEMEEIRSLGEKHQMEWSDTMNLVTSAWWFKFLKSMEISPDEKAEEYGHYPFDEVMEFPSWLNANESCLEQHLSVNSSDEYMQDPALPCMEIEEIEGMDTEWLS